MVALKVSWCGITGRGGCPAGMAKGSNLRAPAARPAALPARRRQALVALPGPETAIFGCYAPCAPIQNRHRNPDLHRETRRPRNRPPRWARTVYARPPELRGRAPPPWCAPRAPTWQGGSHTPRRVNTTMKLFH